MRTLVGFLGLHAVLIATGLTLLRAFGLVSFDSGRRAMVLASGPALLVGMAVLLPLLIVLLVLGIPLTLASTGLACLACAGAAELVARRRASPDKPARAGVERPTPRSSATRGVARVAIVVAGAYTAVAAFALARLPTVLDDARIWSLRGLTLAYYYGLQPEIFQNPAESGGHSVYPLFQPALEAILFQAMGSPQLRFFHTELWLLFTAAIWTAAYLIARSLPRIRRGAPIWLAALALLALTPAAIHNIALGFADITGSVLLATGTLALALWLDQDDTGYLALAVVLLVAAANTKDEDLVASALILIVGAVASLVRSGATGVGSAGNRRLRLLGAAALYFAALVLPWRIWAAAHHLSDSVAPPLPRALSPAYILSRTHELHQTATAMVTQTLTQWGWLAAIFVTACAICLITRTARRTACFYFISFAAIVVSLLWLYTTTPVSLAFLLPTSMNRTVDVFMVPAALATAHLLAKLATSSNAFRSPRPTRSQIPVSRHSA